MKVIFHYVVALVVDDEHPGLPEHDEVILQIERALLENNEEFGISDAKVVTVDRHDLHPETRRRIEARLQEEEPADLDDGTQNPEHERQKGDDDGVEYGDPRDYREEREQGHGGRFGKE